MSNKAAVIHEKGTPDVFRWQDWPVGEPGPGEVLIRHGAIGVNYIDHLQPAWHAASVAGAAAALRLRD